MRSVSINIATRNRNALLKRSLDSIFRQKRSSPVTLADLEVIVVDHGSTDGTKEMINWNYGELVTYEYIDSPNYGSPWLPFNRALELTTNEVIIQQNAECFHRSKTVIKDLAKAVGEKKAVFATVLNIAGDPYNITDEMIEGLTGANVADVKRYSGIYRQVKWFFCGAILTQDFRDLGGYTPNSLPNDVSLADKMTKAGFTFEWLEKPIVIHQSHDKK